jgi:N-methylhydantoinase A
MRRVGIDVGGTFTDVVLLDDDTGEVWSLKVPTTPRDPAEGALVGLRRILERSGSADAVGFIGHGTTIATNMMIEGNGARTGLITTKGFRDILEIRRAWGHDRADLYDLFFKNPAPSRTRHPWPLGICAARSTSASCSTAPSSAGWTAPISPSAWPP